MEEKKDTLGMLDLVIRPGFCVKENQIIMSIRPPRAFSSPPARMSAAASDRLGGVRRVHRRVSVSDAEPDLPQLRRVGHTGGQH